MFEWLNEWLKSIIVIILLAAFVDLILPNQSMQRYVKVVISLFILMTILTPIVQTLVADFDWNKIEFPNTPMDSIVASVPPLEQIERDSYRLREQQNEQAMNIVKNQVEQLINDQIKQTTGTSPLRVKANLAQNEDGEALIERIDIEWSLATLFSDEPDPQNRAEQKDTLEELVAPVKPVSVEGISKVSDPSGRSDPSEVQEAALNEQVDQLEQQIRQLLHREWELGANQIRFIYTEE